MNTPICDFIQKYAEINAVRAHMPGHKAKSFLGFEHLDITEFDGADNLFTPSGIIKESMDNAGKIFGADTFYSTEGSSLSIKAMLYLVYLYAKNKGKKPLILAGRNAHRSFINACALIDFDLEWIYGKNDSYLTCTVTAKDIDDALNSLAEKPTAIYLTSPDYTGGTLDIKSIADICNKHGVFLLVDNAHGAYLKFLKKSEHPIDLGSTMCCDSAHKTLPTLTGASYVHISKHAPEFFKDNVLDALALFGSTSPSYLIMQSLDKINPYLNGDYNADLERCIKRTEQLKNKLKQLGYTIFGQEKIKICIKTKDYGYLGKDFADILKKHNVVCEFYDDDNVVLMLSPQFTEQDFFILEQKFSIIERRPKIQDKPPFTVKPKKAMSVRSAMTSAKELIAVDNANGRILASTSISCPPAIPIIVCGEVIDQSVINAMHYYGIKECHVVK